MSLYSQNVSNNPLSLDGLIVGNFDQVYIDGVPVTPTDTSVLVPYTGATTTVNLNSQKITTTYTAVNAEDLTNKGFTDTTYVPYTGATTTVNLNSQKITTTYVPVNDEDLANKLYNDGRYLKISGFNLSSGAFVFSGTSTVYLHSTTNIVVSTATPTYALGLNASNQLVQFTGGIGDAVLAGGTALSPQYFSGYNTFANVIKTNTINNIGNYLTTGGITFAGIGLYSGTATAFLGIDSGGTVVTTTSTGVPTQLNLTNTTSNVEYYPVFVTLSSSGIQTVLNMSGLTFNPNTTVLTTTKLKITNVPVGTTQYILAVDSTGNVIRGTVTAGDAFLANTQTFTGINTFSNQMTLTKGFDLTLGTVNSFIVRNSSLVTQFSVVNTGVTMGNLVLTGNTLNMSSTSPNAFYSGDNLLISASATVGKNILMTVAGTGFTLDQYGASLSSSVKTFYCNLFEGLSSLGIDMLGGNDCSFKINNTLNISSQPVGWDFKTLYGSYPSYTTNARISGLGVGTNAIYSFSGNPLTLSGANNTINLQSNGVTRFAITDDGTWMPASGSKSFYITDTPPYNATGHYLRLFATNNKVYTDFYNIFQWRVYSGISPLSGLTDIMKLTTTGLTINKSSISHTTLANYELVLGDNITTSNYSAKMLIRGTSANAAQCPSIDFTGWYSHTSIQGSIALYDDGNYGGIFAFIVKPNNSTASGSAQSVMEIRATSANVGRLTFPTTYYVDLVITGQQIGGFAHSSTDVPLKIITGYSLSGSYWWYAGGSTWSTTSSQNMSILTYGTISANGGFTLASDIRIKKDIQPAEQGALKVIDSIPIKSYDLIDNYRDGGKTSFNLIAQELIEVFPEAISKGVSYIPSIYSKCQWITVNADEIEIHINKPHDLVVADEIEILLEDSSLKECDVTAIINETTFRVRKWDDFKMEITDECFIYGKKVKDFLRIDKTKVSMLALAGVKELNKIVETQQEQIRKQQQTIDTLLDHVKRLTEQVNQITLKMI